MGAILTNQGGAPGIGPDIRDVPSPDDVVKFAPGFGARFLVTVDTEEEFDWDKPFERHGHGLSHVPGIAKFQAFCEESGVAPIYLVDYPVASDTRLNTVLGPAIIDGRAEIGVQLHPWVNPPHDEDVNIVNSFAGNLPAALERAKFLTLKREIERAFGQVPRAYRAGRYGVGPNTTAIITDGGITFDTSVRARFDYSREGGPDFRDHPVRPWWIDRAAGLIELPLSTLYCGVLRRQGAWLYHAAARVPRLRGALARLGLLERVPLTPEGVDIDAALRAIDVALADGLPLLVFSFHSPSLSPGHTPYVRDDAALERLYAWWRVVFAHLRTRSVAPAGLSDVIAAIER
jgi:hypothetical protein